MKRLILLILLVPGYLFSQENRQAEFNRGYTDDLIGRSFTITWHSGYLLLGSPGSEKSEQNGLIYPVTDSRGRSLTLDFHNGYCLFRGDIYSWEIYDGYSDRKNDRLNLNMKFINKDGKEADTLLLFDYGAETVSFTIFDNIDGDIYFFDFLLLKENPLQQ